MKNVELVLVQGAANATARLVCPKGKWIRLVAFSAALSTPTAFETPILNMTRGGAVNQVLTRKVMPPLSGAENDIAGAVGITDTPLVQFNVDPATGDVTYAQSTALSVDLPDVWWPWDVDVRIVIASGTVDGALYTYEVGER